MLSKPMTPKNAHKTDKEAEDNVTSGMRWAVACLAAGMTIWVIGVLIISLFVLLVWMLVPILEQVVTVDCPDSFCFLQD